jgi:hypothetical protein
MLNNTIELRTDALVLCNYYRRPEVERAPSIGAWGHILEFINVMAILTNVVTLGFVSDHLASATLANDCNHLGSVACGEGNAAEDAAETILLGVEGQRDMRTGSAELWWRIVLIEHALVLLRSLQRSQVPRTPQWVKKCRDYLLLAMPKVMMTQKEVELEQLQHDAHLRAEAEAQESARQAEEADAGENEDDDGDMDEQDAVLAPGRFVATFAGANARSDPHQMPTILDPATFEIEGSSQAFAGLPDTKQAPPQAPPRPPQTRPVLTLAPGLGAPPPAHGAHGAQHAQHAHATTADELFDLVRSLFVCAEPRTLTPCCCPGADRLGWCRHDHGGRVHALVGHALR